MHTESHSYFKEEITWLFFQLTRKSEPESYKQFENRLCIVLTSLKEKIKGSQEFIPYLKTLYRFIGFSRDTYKGIGEKRFAHIVVVVFFNVFPVLGIYALHRLIKPSSDVGTQFYFGCWKDMKQICLFAYDSSGIKHPLIMYVVRIINTQLKKDVDTWKFSSNCSSKNHISNVAKYIPRENKKYGWLFELLAVDWIQHTKPYILKTASTTESSHKAILKCKRIYRKTFTQMNKHLETTEISLCNQDRSVEDRLILNSASIITAINNEPTFLNIHNDSYDSLFTSEYKKLLITRFTSSTNNHFVLGKSCSKPSIYHIIKFAKKLYDFKDKARSEDIALVNNLWNHFYLFDILKTSKKQLFIPLIDVSYSMSEESLYSSIGIVILISNISSIYKRFIAVDKQPTWINISPDSNIITQVGTIMSFIENMRNTVADFNSAFALIANTLKQTCVNERASSDCPDYKLILISNFKNATFSKDTIQEIFYHYQCSYVPSIMFWNVNNDTCIDVPTSIHCNNSMIFSGYSSSHIHNLCHINTNSKKTVYDHIHKIISNKRFDCFSEYIDKMRNSY